MDSRQAGNDEIDLFALLQVLWRRRLTILVATVTVALGAAGVSLFVLPPIYESRTQILLSENSAPPYSNADASARFLSGRSFLDPIARIYGIRVDHRLVQATPVRDSRIVDLRIRYTDREKLRLFTDAIIQEFMRRSSERVKARRGSAERRLTEVNEQLREIERMVQVTRQTLERIAAGNPGDAPSWLARSVVLNSVGISEGLYSGLLSAQRDLRNEILALDTPSLVQGPYIPQRPISPRPGLNTGIAAGFGLFAGVALALVFEAIRLHSSFQTPAQPASLSSPSWRAPHVSD